ncbi:hypothetical protein R3P38DRAFT_2798665 [Favolaschia claudopus]|uniref:Uncharacterized protein n=1 Tax=Favolaschia claudopus TaxID=2862362 RepID=A0AAW0A1M9_9AGAR
MADIFYHLSNIPPNISWVNSVFFGATECYVATRFLPVATGRYRRYVALRRQGPSLQQKPSPYQAFIYDLLHFLESGKWGNHLWRLTLDLLEEPNLLTEATKCFPDAQNISATWPRKILPTVKLISIFSSALSTFCVRFFKPDSMHSSIAQVSDGARLTRDDCIEEYEKCCQGVLRNGTTRTGEGTHREVKQHYRQTNMRNAEAQIAVRDEDKEVVAQTRLIIDDFFKVNSHIDSQSGLNTSDESDAEKKTAELTQFRQAPGSARRVPKSKIPLASDSNQWIFGSPLQYGDSRSYEDLYGGNNPVYRELDPRLRDFLHNQFPEESVAYEDNIAASFKT